MYKKSNQKTINFSDKDYKKAQKLAKKIVNNIDNNGTIVGIEVGDNQTAIISDKELNGHLFIGGTTGSGKTITLKNFIISAIERNIPLIYVDGKGDQKLPVEIKKVCQQFGREFKLFEMDPNSKTKYNPLASGSFTELKDKIIASDTFTVAEGEYLQFLFKILKNSGKKIDLGILSKYITIPKMLELVNDIDDVTISHQAFEIKERLHNKIDNLISTINSLINSEIGHLFKCSESDTIINLTQDIEKGTVIYFSLNDLSYASYASKLGRIIINDIKSIFGSISESNPIKTFAIFDEFSAYATDEATTILTRARSKGVHAIIGSQSFDTIDKISPKLASDIVANCNTFIIHKQNSDIDAQKISDIIGRNTLEDGTKISKVSSDKIQNLTEGYAYILRKKENSKINLVKIRFVES